ncbi:hypothetical protein J2Y69_002862 [Microbacterium resistens]|uniref:Uncharacterized protein n=1 Tax=Microbacterium resistens TaxID=156977 RepID=A0ABU1SG20_9MICO|nr:hypothetical protein [Microbacterium resistens]MDR6868248.1 hypothetical protein [Microbacterium resistens]
MRDVLGWLLIALMIATPLGLAVIMGMTLLSRKPIEEKYQHTRGGGAVGVFDAVWSPSAHEAGMELDRQTKRTAPAPAPGDPPWTISGDRITIDVDKQP